MPREQKKKLIPVSTAGTRLVMVWVFLKTLVKCLLHYSSYLWRYNPLRVLSQRQRRLYFVENYGEVMIKPRFTERVLDLFLTDYRRRQRLLHWVHSKIRLPKVTDFSTSWQDGIALCAILESICPGVCPSYHLLSHLNRVKNCRLGLKLANKYLYVPMDLISPEEMAIAGKSSEHKIIQYISMLKWASENIKEKWSSLHESLIAAKSGRCFAKGSGLRNGIVGKRSKFTIIVSDTIGVFNMLVEIRGPNNEYCGERLVSLHQAKGVLDKSFDINSTYSDTIKYLEDGVGNTFIRKKVPPRYAMDSGDLIHMDIQCGDEGTFYVTFVPRRAGIHAVAVKWQNHHVENSPFRIKVFKATNVSTKSLKGAQEKRVIYDSLSFTTYTGSSQDSIDNLDTREDVPSIEIGEKNGRSGNAIAKAKAYSKGRQLTVTRRRVLRRIITRNGEDIVIEEAISPSLSRQSSITDNSDEDSRIQRKDKEEHKPSAHSQYHMTSHPPHPPMLGTVVEERSYSRDKDKGKRDIEHHEQQNGGNTIRSPLECQENVNGETKSESDGKALTVDGASQKTTEDNVFMFSDDNTGKHDTHGSKTKDIPKKRPLTRTSITNHQKPLARRTTSDGPMYQLRKVALGTSLLSDTGSEVSSDDKASATDDETGPTLKMLHSTSLNKACMYISQKAFNQTCSSLGEEEVGSVDCSNLNIPAKTKLRATQSLPIMRKMWKTETSGHQKQQSIQDTTAHTNYESKEFSDNSLHTLSGEMRSGLDDLENIITLDKDGKFNIDKLVNTETNNLSTQKICQSELHKEMCTAHDLINDPGSDIEAFVQDKLRTEQSTSEKNSPKWTGNGTRGKNSTELFDNAIKMLECFASPNDISALHTGLSVKDDKPQSKGRGNLRRQWSVFQQRSSGESSSDTEKKRSRKAKGLDSSVSVDSSAVFNFDLKHSFQSINMQAMQEKRDNTTGVCIVMPKPKMDKTTQVSEKEIILETGWDLVEGFYLLLKRISIKVPCETNFNFQSFFTSEDKIDSQNETQGKDVSLIDDEDTTEVYDGSNDVQNEEIIEDNQNDGNMLIPGDMAAHYRLSAWLQEHGMALPDFGHLAPVRQVTVETVDSGFDDHPTFNRQARHSMPSLRTTNGHVRLHRRPYRGQIMLDRKLVVSSQSVSLERPEQGHEADDELLPNSTDKHQARHLRRRHRQRFRQESFSMSDSEISQRRSTNKRRIFQNKRYLIRNNANDSRTGKLDSLSLSQEKSSDSQKTSKSRKSGKRQLNSESKSGTEEIGEIIDQSYEPRSKSYRMDIKADHPPSVWRNRSSTRSKSSSIDSNYNGFGISKHGRDDLLAQIDTFQSLYPTEESPSEDVFTLDNQSPVESNETVDTTSKQFECTNDMKNDLEKDTDDIQNRGLDDLNNLYEYVVSDSTLDTEDLNDVGYTPETGRSVLESDSGSDDVNIDIKSSEDVFDMFSSFDHSHLNDVLPRQESLTFLEGYEDNTAAKEPSSSDAPQDQQTVVKVAGVGHKYGQVGSNNSFQVWIENPSSGSLSVNVIGPRSHTVTETSVIYTGDNLYEVSYGATQPGFYRIYIRWGELEVPGCPYICEVTL